MASRAEYLRQQADREVRELMIDRDVRDAAQAGKDDGTANYWRSIDTGHGMLDVYATFGAGTNSAKVIDSRLGITVYEASDYGRHLITYRRGEWVEVVRACGMAYRDRQAAERLCNEVVGDEMEAERFTPLEG